MNLIFFLRSQKKQKRNLINKDQLLLIKSMENIKIMLLILILMFTKKKH